MSTQITTVRGLLDKDSVKERINEIMGRRGPQFSAALVQTVKQSYMLQKCKPETIIGAALTAAALDLSVDPNLQHAHIVPYGTDAQFQIGYKGLIQLAQRSGQMLRINDVVIPKGALVNWNPLTEDLDVDFNREGIDWDAKPDGYAVYFKTISGFEKTVFWSYERAYAHGRRFSKSFNSKSSPWQSDFDAMALKSVLKYALGRYGPLSIEVQANVAKDQGVIGLDGSAQFSDNPTSGELKRADFSETSGSVTEVTEEDLKKTESVVESEPAEDSNDKAKNIEIIENAIVDLAFNGEVVFEFLKGKKLVAPSAATLQDVPNAKLAKIAENIGDILNDYAVE